MEANTPNGMENHCKKSKQKVECTDNGHNRCLGGDAEEYDDLSEFWVIIASNAGNGLWKVNIIKNKKMVWEKDITVAMPENGV